MADAIGYVRVTTKEQADDGDSIEAQTARLQAAAAAGGDTLIDIVADKGKSAKNLRRPGIQQVLARLRAGDALRMWATKLDRVTRRPADLEFLLERHFGADAPHRLILANEPHDAKTAAGRLTLRILVAIAQHELDQVAERTQVIVEHKKSDKRILGGLPLGFDRDGDKLVPNAGELAVLERIKQLNTAGKGPREIARTLAGEGHKTKRGGAWRACTVVKLLERVK